MDRPNATSAESDRKQAPEPRWLVLIAVLVAGGLYAAIAPELAIGPRWLLLVIIIALSLPALISHHTGYHKANTILGYLSEGILTVFLLCSVGLLIRAAQQDDRRQGTALLGRRDVALQRPALCLWYWRLDGGGPYARHAHGEHAKGAFLFPPMTQDGRRAVGGDWSPRFIDYLFLAFNTSTALSPTDTPILSRWAKILVILQAIISLTLVTVLAARAINIM